MERISFNKNWEFILDQDVDGFPLYGFDKYSNATGPAARRYEHSNWEQVDLPHDWAAALPVDPSGNTFKGAKDLSHYSLGYTEGLLEGKTVYNIGWYRKQFALSDEWQGKQIFLAFEGIFRDATVWVNGTYMTRHTSGYTGFRLDITDHLWENEPNSIAVRVDCDQPEGWWYEGAGIYRNVWLEIAEPVYAVPEKTVIRTALDGTVGVHAIVANETDRAFAGSAVWTVLGQDGVAVARVETAVSVAPFGQAPVAAELQIPEPRLWSVDTPYLYTLELRIGAERQICRFGVRTVAFDSNRGFLLNGKPLKVRGACNHQDLGGVGVALSDNLNTYKIKRFKEMGVNAYRSAHHAPSPALLDACDELGMLVMDETRTFGTSPEAQAQLTALIERDRNHPCVFIWSLGNEEEFVQSKPLGYRLMEKMMRLARSLDATRPVTYGGNNGSNTVGANGAAEVRGVNYIRTGQKEMLQLGENWLDRYHAEHPDQSIIGTEESSYVLSRGGMRTDLGSGELESFGNVTMSWGSTPKGWVKFMETRDYFAGSFMWTGFDYRGEPNPFVHTNYSSSFGTIDLCGMEKPPFYYYQAWWTALPVLKLATHWNHTPGENVTVAIFTNCDRVTLYLNGRELEMVRVERFDLPQVKLRYEAGVLEAVGVKDGKVYRDRLVTAGEAASVQIKPELIGKGEDEVSIYELSALDEAGVLCPLAERRVNLRISGGRIVGVCNGDPSTTEPEVRKPTEQAVRINKFNGEHGLYSVPPVIKNRRAFRYDFMEQEGQTAFFEDDLRMVARFKYSLQPKETRRFTTCVELREDHAYIEFERLYGDVRVLVDGKEIGNNLTDTWKNRPYRFYHDFQQGRHEIEVVAEVTETTDDVISGTVKIGRLCEPMWSVRLHYGKARVFVRSKAPAAVRLLATLADGEV